MARTVTHVMEYAAPVDAVAAMLADPTFREEVCARQKAIRATVDITVDGDTKDVRVDQWLPTEGLPSVATKIVGKETNILQVEHWSSPTHADVTVTIPGKPGEMVGTAILEETPTGTRETVQLTVTVKIPLVSGKLETIIGDLLLKALRYEEKTGHDYLSR